MKKILLLLVFMLNVITISFAQPAEIPDAARKSFMEKYPLAKSVKWSQDTLHYNASFKEGKNSSIAHYTLDGKWNYTEKFIDKRNLPKAVAEGYAKSKKAYPEYKSSAYLESYHGEKAYRIESRKGKARIFIFYTKDGREINSMIGH